MIFEVASGVVVCIHVLIGVLADAFTGHRHGNHNRQTHRGLGDDCLYVFGMGQVGGAQ